jgi:hypothetical protein
MVLLYQKGKNMLKDKRSSKQRKFAEDTLLLQQTLNHLPKVIVSAPQGRDKHDGGIVPSSMSRLKPAMYLIVTENKKTGEKRFIWKAKKNTVRYAYPINDPTHDPKTKARNERADKYEQRLNFDYTKKRHYGRFTQNPRAPRAVAIKE